ncbi:MAG TPA: UbiD family decarboxylase, partial [Chitinophagaceae bacterium]|nr:UbiD family decarboxylase [Chitinophagaceae bacterium]
LGFGGKMCIDGTAKENEEIDDAYDLKDAQPSSNAIQKCLQNYADIKSVNLSLLSKNIPCLIVAVQKNKKEHIKILHEEICGNTAFVGVKMILYVEHTVDANDLPVALWRFCNNLDPKRDFHLVKKYWPQAHENSPTKYWACMGLDGTRKTKKWDGFQRDWPNIIIADDATIKKVDEKWNQLGIGDLITSPSLKYKNQLYGEEAVVNTNE